MIETQLHVQPLLAERLTDFASPGSLCGRGAMPINPLFSGGRIKPEEVERLNRAFKFTLRSLCLVDRDDPLCEIVARKVIEIDANSTHDPKEIAKLAEREFGVGK